MAYKTLLAKANDKCKKWSLERGAMHLQVRRMNNDAKREQFIELAAFSMWRMARILLSMIEGVPYDSHNLVADMLTLHHSVVLKEMCTLEEFIAAYKKMNKCGRDIEDPNAMYSRRFSHATEPDESITTQVHQNPASPADDATRDVNMIPRSTTRKDSTLPSTNLFGNDEKEPTAAVAAPASLEALHTAYREKLAMIMAMAADSQNLQKMVKNNEKLADMGKWGKDLIEKEGGITAEVATKIAGGDDDGDDKKMPATPTKTTPTKRLAAPKLIYDPYSKKYRFTRNESSVEAMEWLQSLDESLKMQVCEQECLIDSIRARNFQLPGELPPAPSPESVGKDELPDGKDPPQFTNNPKGPPEGPPGDLNSIPLEKIEKLCNTLGLHCDRMFNKSVVVFKRQCGTNKIIENISASEKELKTAETAEKSSAVHWKNRSLPETRIVHELIEDAAQSAAKDKLRKTNNNVDEVEAKIATLQKEMNKLKREKKRKQRDADDDSNAKELGGPNSGARKRNPYASTTATTTIPPSQETQSNLSEVSPKRQRKGKKETHLSEKQKHRETPHGGKQRGGQLNAPPQVSNVPNSAGAVPNEHGGPGKGKMKKRYKNKSWSRDRDSAQGKGRGMGP